MLLDLNFLVLLELGYKSSRRLTFPPESISTASASLGDQLRRPAFMWLIKEG